MAKDFAADGFPTRALRFGGTGTTGGVAGEGAVVARPPAAIVDPTIAFGCSGAAVLVGLFAVAGFFGGALAAALLRSSVLGRRAFPGAADLRLARTSLVFLVFLPAVACLRAFAGVLRFAACLRFLAM